MRAFSLVEDAEGVTALLRALSNCRSAQELTLAVRCLGYLITRIVLQRALEEERRECQRQAQG